MPGVKFEQDGIYFGPEGDEVVTEDEAPEQTTSLITGMNKAEVMKYLDARLVEYDKKQGVKALQKIAKDAPAEPVSADYVVVDGVIVRPTANADEQSGDQTGDQTQGALEAGGGLFDGGGSSDDFGGEGSTAGDAGDSGDGDGGDDSFPDPPANGGGE